MTNRVQIFRTPTTGVAPAAGTRLAGELWLNLADFQLGFIDAARNAQKLVAVRYFQATANYAAGDVVVQAGALYVASGAVTAGAFTPAQWTKLSTAADITAALAAYLPLAGGTLTGPLALAANPTLPAQAANKAYVDSQVTAAPFLPLAGGTMTGLVTLSGPPTAPNHAATKAYADSGAFLPVAGGTMTGPIVLAADPAAPLQAATRQYTDRMLPLAGGTLTGPLNGTTATFNGQVTGGPFTMTTGFGSAALYNASGGTMTLANQTIATNIQLDSGSNFLANIGGGAAIKPGGGPWTAPSDARIKTVQGDYKRGLDEILKLQPIVYTYKGNDQLALDQPSMHAAVAGDQRPFTGLIAQAVETILPEMVTKRAGFIDGKPVDDLRDLDTTPLVYALLNAVKALAARIEALETA